MALSLGEIAMAQGCELRGDPDLVVSRVATLQDAGAEDIAFLANPAYRQYLGSTRAAAVIVPPDAVDDCPVACLITDNPHECFARIAAMLYPMPEVVPGIHPTAVVDERAQVPGSCEVGPGAVIAAGARLGENVFVGPRCVIGRDVAVGADTRLLAGVTIYDGVRIGERCTIHSGTVIGSDGFGLAPQADGSWLKVPQVGSVRIGDDVEIQANCAIDRGAIGDTVIGDGVKLDNLVHVGHNVSIGDHSAIAGQVGFSGSCSIGKHVMIAGQSGVAGHISVTDQVVLTGQSMVTNSISSPGVYSSGIPVDQSRSWRKNAVRFRHLDELARRVGELEKQLRRPDSETED